MTDLFLGCDPGAKGSICILNPQNKKTLFYPTPGGPDPLGFLLYTLEMRAPIDLCKRMAIEEVHSIHRMSAKSNFNFGYNVGAAHMLLQGIGWRYKKELYLIQPKVWQKGVGITVKGKAIKKAVAKLAHSLYPEAPLYGPRGGLMDGRADALMIAHYLYMQE